MSVRTNHPERYLGRLPNDPRKPRLKLKPKSDTLLSPPTISDWYSQIKSWGMACNDKVGCCTISDAAHQSMQTEWYGQGKVVSVSDADVMKAYSAVSGYKPGDSSTDNGAVIQDVLNYWRTTGIGGYKIEAFAQLDASNIDLVRLCVSIFGAVDIGFDFPSSAMTQFDSGATWTPVTHARIEGGHCVPIVGYDATTLTCVTWGRAQKMDLAFWRQYVQPGNDVWVAIDTDWLRNVGTSPAGLDVATLNADYLSITGSAGPGPFAGVIPPPIPAPPPTPTPAPTPTPKPSNDAAADKALAVAMRAWLAERKL